VPGRHGAHDATEAASEYVPGAHAAHANSAVAPAALELVPGAHTVHDGEAVPMPVA
jgi:hypothetical protein